MRRIRLVFVFLSALLVAACDATAPDDRRVVAGVDFDRLFSPALPAEIEAAARAWEGRDVSVRDYTVAFAETLAVRGQATVIRVVSHTVGGVRHYGGVLAPQDAPPTSLPVLLYLHGGDRGVSLDEEVLLALNFMPDLGNGFVVVVPSFRAEALRYRGQTYTSGGPPSPWDRDVDDALALLNTALATIPAADPARIGVVGFSRGAAVGMLMAARDARLKRLVAFFGPTDFLGPFAQSVVEDALRGRPRDLPGVNYLDQTYIQPLKAGALSYEAARSAFIRRSPIYFAARLPALQVHHGTGDPIVPVDESRALDAALRRLGRQAPGYAFYLYEGGTHFPLALPGSLERTAAFLSEL